MSISASTTDRKFSMSIIFAVVGGLIAAVIGLPIGLMIVIGWLFGLIIG